MPEKIGDSAVNVHWDVFKRIFPRRKLEHANYGAQWDVIEWFVSHFWVASCFFFFYSHASITHFHNDKEISKNRGQRSCLLSTLDHRKEICVPTKIEQCADVCAANFQILKIAETLAIGSPYWVNHCCVVHLWNNFLIRQKMTKIDFIARHKRIRVEKSVILTQPTCPTDKARRHVFVISLFYNLFKF